MLAGIDGFGQQRGPRLRGRGVEEHAVVPVRQCLVEVRGPARDAKALGQTFDFVRVAADQDRIGHDAIAVAEALPRPGRGSR